MITPAIARCIARISGDGNLYTGKQNSRKNMYVRYSNTCKTLIDNFVADIRTIFGNIPMTHGTTHDNVIFVQTHRKQVAEFFLNFLKSYKSEDICIPTEVLSASTSLISEYVRAFSDDEGSVRLRIFKRTNEWKREIAICSKSLTILRQLKILLGERFGVLSNAIRKETKRNGRFWHTLQISGRQNIENFRKTIGFSHPLKSQRLDLLLATYGKTVSRNPVGFRKFAAKLYSLRRPIQPS